MFSYLTYIYQYIKKKKGTRHECVLDWCVNMWQCHTDYLLPLCKRSFEETSLDICAWSGYITPPISRNPPFTISENTISNLFSNILFKNLNVKHTNNHLLHLKRPGWQFETTMNCQCIKSTLIYTMSRF